MRWRREMGVMARRNGVGAEGAGLSKLHTSPEIARKKAGLRQLTFAIFWDNHSIVFWSQDFDF